MSRILTIALTGGIGSGKSTVAEKFAELGVPVIDSDIIAREIVELGKPALNQLVAEFGQDILSAQGELDRKKLASIIFHDLGKKKTLENLLHPAIYNEIDRQIATLNFPYCIVVIPLLIETGAGNRFDRVLVVDVPEQLQLARTISRDNTTQELARKIIESQASNEERLAHADDVIHNDVKIAELGRIVEAFHEKYLGLCKSDNDDNPN